MAGNELFEELPEQARPQADAIPLGAPRLRQPSAIKSSCEQWMSTA
jgi:hypothetical protein